MQYEQLAALFATEHQGQIRNNDSRSWMVFIAEHPYYTVTATTAVELRDKLWLSNKDPRIFRFGAGTHLDIDDMLLDVFDVEPKMTQGAWQRHLENGHRTRFVFELKTEVLEWRRLPIEIISLRPLSALQVLYENRNGQLPFQPRQNFPRLRDFARCLRIISKETVVHAHAA